jgi:hypothetical protein
MEEGHDIKGAHVKAEKGGGGGGGDRGGKGGAQITTSAVGQLTVKFFIGLLMMKEWSWSVPSPPVVEAPWQRKNVKIMPAGQCYKIKRAV